MRSAAIVLLATVIPGLAAAFEWSTTEVIDGPVASISPAQGNAVVSDGDRWYVTYVKDGDVWVRVHEDGVWQAPMQMETDASAAVAPQLGSTAEFVVLAWQDDRSGHPEIYTRIRDADGIWSAEECRTCDDTPSRAPAMSHGLGALYTSTAHLVWEEGPVGSAVIEAAYRDEEGWTAMGAVSTVPGGETPAVSIAVGGGPVVAWIDRRDGDPVLYTRLMSGGEWLEEQPLALPEGTDVRNPSLHYEFCCSDLVEGSTALYAEAIFGGNPQTVATTIGDGPILPDLELQGTSGVGVSVDGFQFQGAAGCGDFGGFEPRFFHVWSEPGGTVRFRAVDDGTMHLLTEAAITPASVGGREGKPEAGVLAVWVEEVGGGPSLVGRMATELGGYSYEVEDPPPSLLVAPAGTPTNDFRLIDGYTGDPWTWPEHVGVALSPALAADLTLDEGERWYLVDQVDGDGWARVGIPGGGCSQAGTAHFACRHFGGDLEYDGVKSPDVDGDCVVTATDLAYVEAQIGTDDYCGDLDGSGTVDASDVAIVEATLGDACAFVDVADGVAVPKPMLRVDRNPFRASTTLRLALPTGPARVEVYDVGGRRVRVLAEALEAGGQVVSFDGRDDAGNVLSAGTYFVSVTTPDRTLHERLTLLR